ncbi:hypothetical protein [Candidatus Berkiella aquae]|uniref:Uncharacterized protein n=1 Tax=Candidatus Berkiella aquae TaxID=295108 RepID=A0A0Q9YTI6_9GAMM|nr:hypothetical protein [Candidatus Berkiella aquae]MCS5710652.1 hypothetical protein [Candidatus Berkiella aquae]
MSSSSGPDSSSSLINRMFDYQQEKNALNAYLTSDAVRIASEGGLSYANGYLAEVYFKKITDLVDKHHLQAQKSKWLQVAKDDFAKSIAIGVICHPGQQEVQAYDKWSSGKGGKGSFGYYLYYAYESVSGKPGSDAKFKPPLLMDNFEADLATLKEVSKPRAKP